MKLEKSCDKLALYCGVLGVGVLWVGLTLAAIRTHMDILGVQPLSSLGVKPLSARLFTVTLVLSALLFMGFGWFLYNKLHLCKTFIIVFAASHLAEIVTGVVHFGGKQKSIHTFAAFGWALTIPLAMYFFQKSLKHNSISRSAKYFWWLQMIATIAGIGAFIVLGKALPLCQLLIALPFHAWIIYTTILIIRLKRFTA